MSILHVQNKVGTLTNGTAIPATFGAAVGSGNAACGILVLGSDTVADLTSITDDKGNSYTAVDSQNSGGGGQSIISFFALNLTNAPTTITANLSVSVNFCLMIIDEFSGVASAAALDGHLAANQVTPGTGTDAITTGLVTTAANGDLVYGGATLLASGIALTHGTGFTLGGSVASTVPAATEYKSQTTAGAIAATFTEASSAHSVVAGFALKPAAGGSPTDDIAPRSGPPTVLFPGMIAPAGLGWLINRRNKLGWRKSASGLWRR